MDLISKIGLGTVQFGIKYGISNKSGKTTEYEVGQILEKLSSYKISFIDTASGYGNAEEVLGKYDLTNFNIITKFMPPNSGDTLISLLNKSLSRLGINSIYAYLAHRPLDLIKNRSHWDQLIALRDVGKVKKIGFSLNSPDELKQLLKEGMEPDLVQVPYNYFDNRFKEDLIKLKTMGCEIHSRSTYLQGIFFTDTKKLPSFFNPLKQNIDFLKIEHKLNLAGVLLKYVLSQYFIDVVIMGVENQNQLKSNIDMVSSAKLLKPKEFNFSESLLMPSNWPN